MMLSVPPNPRTPQGVWLGSRWATASALSMSRVMAMISDSNLLMDGHMSRCSALVWLKYPKHSFRKS